MMERFYLLLVSVWIYVQNFYPIFQENLIFLKFHEVFKNVKFLSNRITKFQVLKFLNKILSSDSGLFLCHEVKTCYAPIQVRVLILFYSFKHFWNFSFCIFFQIIPSAQSLIFLSSACLSLHRTSKYLDSSYSCVDVLLN